MLDRPYCKRCFSTWEERIRREYVIREKEILKDVENKHWSIETLSNARRKLNRGQRAEIRSLRNMGDGAAALGEAERFSNIQDGAGNEL